MKKIDTTNESEKNESVEAAEAQEPLAPIEAETIAPEQLEELKERAAKADEYWERLLRATADFDNFKKRAAREKQEAIRFANESLIEKLVPVLDSFDMAVTATQTTGGEAAQAYQTGVTMILQQFKSVLVEAGLEEINAVGQAFDPNLHEAIAQQESADVPEGHVIQQIRKGYRLRERLIRPASVIVAKPLAS